MAVILEANRELARREAEGHDVIRESIAITAWSVVPSFPHPTPRARVSWLEAIGEDFSVDRYEDEIGRGHLEGWRHAGIEPGIEHIDAFSSQKRA